MFLLLLHEKTSTFFKPKTSTYLGLDGQPSSKKIPSDLIGATQNLRKLGLTIDEVFANSLSWT